MAGPPSTAVPTEVVQDAFAVRYRRAKVTWLAWSLVFLVVAAVNGPGRSTELGWLDYLAFSVLGGLLLFHVWNWRCPACRWYLGNWLFARTCWRCKLDLR